MEVSPALSGKVLQQIADGHGFSPGHSPVSSRHDAGRRRVSEILIEFGVKHRSN